MVLITRALLQADAQFKLVHDNLDDLAAGHNKRRIIQQAISNELCKILDTGKPSFTPKKGKTSVVMFVGLQVKFVSFSFCVFKKPDLVIFVMDSTIAQVAYDQAQAFKQSAGALIVTKMAKGGGTLMTKSPVILISTGEHMDSVCIVLIFQLCMGDWSRFMDRIQEVVPMDQLPELLQKLSEGIFILGIMCEQFQNLLKWVPLARFSTNHAVLLDLPKRR
uniref:SRP54-type proteins GTP-binding domain-containing protein n=1 Tax=Salix viminalis TaxID=40686 RepID=A0A6N2L3H3_SALVM